MSDRTFLAVFVELMVRHFNELNKYSKYKLKMIDLWDISAIEQHAHNSPELYSLGAKSGREVLEQVLNGAVKDSDLIAKDAESVATGILSENAYTLHSQAKGV